MPGGVYIGVFPICRYFLCFDGVDYERIFRGNLLSCRSCRPVVIPAFGVARSGDQSQRELWLYTARWWSRRGVLHAQRQFPKRQRLRFWPSATVAKIQCFQKKLRTSYIYSAAFWLLTRGRPGPNISRNERMHWQVAKASMARRRLGWESAEASATSLLQLPLMDGTFCCKALRWSTMKKQAVLVQIIYFPKLPKAGIGGKTRGVRSQCFTDTGCEELETFRWVFSRRASRDSRMEAWGDDCIHRASVGWGFQSEEQHDWHDLRPWRILLWLITYDYLAQSQDWPQDSMNHGTHGMPSWSEIHPNKAFQRAKDKFGFITQDDGSSMFVLSYSQNPNPRTAADSRWVAVMVNSCAPSPGSCSAFGMVIPPAGTRARSLVERSWTSSGNQKEKRCLEQHKGKQNIWADVDLPDGPPKEHEINIEILTHLSRNSWWLALPLQIWGVAGGFVRCGGRPQDWQTQGRECDILSGESMFFPAHMRKRNQMDLTQPNPLTGGPTIGQWRACYCSQGQGWGRVR